MFLFQSRKGQCCSCTSIDTSSNRIARELFVVKGIRGLETSWTKLDLPKVCKCQVSKHYTNNKVTRLQWRIQERGPGPPLTEAQRTKKKIGGGGGLPLPPISWPGSGTAYVPQLPPHSSPLLCLSLVKILDGRNIFSPSFFL